MKQFYLRQIPRPELPETRWEIKARADNTELSTRPVDNFVDYHGNLQGFLCPYRDKQKMAKKSPNQNKPFKNIRLHVKRA